MRKEDKALIIEQLSKKVSEYPHFYIADATGLNAANTSELRRQCNGENIEMIVVKNTLFKKALESVGKNIEGIDTMLKSQSAVFFTHTANTPAKLIKKFRGKDKQIPLLKGAYVEESSYLGDKNLETLASLKSKNELIADVILMLKSPMSNLLSQLNSAPNIIGGIVKTLSEKEN